MERKSSPNMIGMCLLAIITLLWFHKQYKSTDTQIFVSAKWNVNHYIPNALSQETFGDIRN